MDAPATVKAPTPPKGRINLARRLTVGNTLAFLIAAIVLVLLYRHDQIEEHSTLLAGENERTAHHLARLFGNRIAAFVARSDAPETDDPRRHPEIAALDALLNEHADGSILKIKIYAPGGTTVYSSVHDDIGGTSRNLDALAAALRGEIRHKLEFRPLFHARGGELHDRHIIQTYMPLRDGERIAGVFELYADITPSMERIGEHLVRIALILAAVFGSLHAILFLSARHADRVLQRRREALAASMQRIAVDEAHLRAMLDTALDGIIGIDRDDRLTEFNHAAESMFGWRREEVIGRPMAELLVPERYRAAHRAGMARFIATREMRVMNRHIEIAALRRDGSEFPIELSITTFSDGGRDLFTAYVRDITERQRTEDELRISAIAFESQEGMFITDARGIIRRVNRAFIETTGYSAEEAVGQTPGLLRSGRHDEQFYQDMWRTLQRDGYWQGEIWNRRKNGELFPEWLTITAVKDGQGGITHHVAAFSDITQRKAAEEEIKHLAFYDPLTRLPNRRLLIDRLHQAVASGARSKRHGALLFIDLDNFKNLNDTLGHDMGDRLLQQVAARLEECVREEDTVARLGGDEFVVMLEDLGPRAEEAATQTENVGEKILDSLNRPYPLGEHEHHSTPSIGVTLFLGRETGVDDLLKRADLAMYEAKAAGRNTLRFFDPEMQAAVSTRSALETDLREALRHDQFVLHYQPQVDEQGQAIGAEALLRWQHPRRGLVPPAEFIPLAEETGLILPLGDWVLRTACERLARWQAAPETAGLVLAVNVSARQFRQPDFVDKVLATLAATGANPQRLELELTESLLLDDIENTIDKMIALKAKGVSFSLDDFGTGYSSLAYLKRLPLDQLKIDRSFVHDVLNDPNDAVIARAIVALGQSLGLAVVAEGVETEAQRDFLVANDCHLFQGYLFGRPEP